MGYTDVGAVIHLASPLSGCGDPAEVLNVSYLDYLVSSMLFADATFKRRLLKALSILFVKLTEQE